MCCELFCKEFKGWCQSFTKAERALTVLEAVLLVVLVIFLIFLILHLLACSTPTFEPQYEETKKYDEYEYTENSVGPTKHTTLRTKPITTKLTTSTATGTETTSTTRQTIDPGIECSWTPSAKTTALTHYYEKNAILTTRVLDKKLANTKPKINVRFTTKSNRVDTKLEHNVNFIEVDRSDGEHADALENKYILSLVKLKPPNGVVFGCILTIINEYWMLTSASCIEAVEEVDSLDSFVIMEDYGTSYNGKIHSVFDVQIHPFYQGMNKSYDLAVIKSESGLLNGKAVELPTTLDNSIITIGERFNLLGFGTYRYIPICILFHKYSTPHFH